MSQKPKYIPTQQLQKKKGLYMLISIDWIKDFVNVPTDMTPKELGEKFDIRYFHDEVLCDGGITLPILENKITSPGNKFIFIRVISPSGNVLTQNKKETISIDQEKTIEISAKREINYQNQNTDVCIYYEIEATLNPGKYSVEIYAENQKIGLTSFALK